MLTIRMGPSPWPDPLSVWLTLHGRCPAGVGLRHRFVANQVRIAQFVLACNLGDFLRRLALPATLRHWSLRSVQVKLTKIGAKVVRHARQLVFQMAEVAVSRELFPQILERICALAPDAG